MKGKIDVTVEAENSSGIRQKVPLELKTGRASYSAEHKGQVTMYSMMLNEKLGGGYSNTIPPGLLVYLKDGTMQEVNNSPFAMKGEFNCVFGLNCHGLIQLRLTQIWMHQTGLKSYSHVIWFHFPLQ